MSVPPYAVVLDWFKALPDWFKAVALGGTLVLVALWFVVGAQPGPAAAENTKAIESLRSKVESQQEQLHRMEGKLDQLLLKLIPGK